MGSLSSFHLELIDMEKVNFSGPVKSIRLPTAEGELGIWAHHAPMMALLAPGVITLQHLEDDRREMVLVSGGLVEVLDNRVRVLVDKWGHDKQEAWLLEEDRKAEPSSQNERELMADMGKRMKAIVAKLRSKDLQSYAAEHDKYDKIKP